MGMKGDVPATPTPSTAVPETATTITTTGTDTAAERTTAPTAATPAAIPRIYDTGLPAPPTAVDRTAEGQLVPPSRDKGMLGE